MAAGIRDIFRWTSTDASSPPPLWKYRSSHWFILLTICLAVFTDIFLYGIIVPVIPFALTNRAGVSPQDVQHWVSVLLAVYGASLLAASPICGWVADHTASRRLPLLVGLLTLAGSTLLLCLGNKIALLILGRALQGISAAVVWTVGLALLVDTVGQETVGQSMGYVAIAMSFAILLAPLLGGVVYARSGYYPVFYMAFGLIVLDVVMRIALIEKKIARRWIVGTSEAPSIELTASGPSETITAPSPTSASNPKTAQRTKSSVVLLLTSRRLLAALYCSLTQSTLLTAWDAVLPLYTHRIFGFSSVGAGLIFLPLILPSFLSPLFGLWSDRKGPRAPTALGFVAAVPFLVLLRFVNHDSTRQIVLLCALLVFIGLALSMAMTPLLAEITYVVGHKEKSHPGAFGGKGAYALSYGLFNSFFAGGMLVGPIWGGFVTQGKGWGTLCWTLALLSISGAVVAELWVGGWIVRSRRVEQERKLEARNSGRGEV